MRLSSTARSLRACDELTGDAVIDSQVPIWRALVVLVFKALNGRVTLHRMDVLHRSADIAGLPDKAKEETLNVDGLSYQQHLKGILGAVALPGFCRGTSR